MLNYEYYFDTFQNYEPNIELANFQNFPEMETLCIFDAEFIYK